MNAAAYSGAERRVRLILKAHGVHPTDSIVHELTNEIVNAVERSRLEEHNAAIGRLERLRDEGV